ncbi:hypothetical protein GCM10010965_28560 [Caldalkalibacillus thermarum]|nr:hypothetical protein GCM10010965_28560 [Caldalkalibacillus thermarum]
MRGLALSVQFINLKFAVNQFQQGGCQAMLAGQLNNPHGLTFIRYDLTCPMLSGQYLSCNASRQMKGL